jgi:hypothetical protein
MAGAVEHRGAGAGLAFHQNLETPVKHKTASEKEDLGSDLRVWGCHESEQPTGSAVTSSLSEAAEATGDARREERYRAPPVAPRRRASPARRAAAAAARLVMVGHGVGFWWRRRMPKWDETTA